MSSFFLFISIFLFTSSAWSQDQKMKEPTQCLCPKIYMPVCAGHRNFGNSCEAECAGFKNVEEGHCPKPVNKPKITPTYQKNKTK